jgi:DinB family protein
MNKSMFLDTLRAGRAEWEALLAQIGEARMLQLGAAGEWSVKDVIAHVTWGERETVELLQAHALVGSDLWNLPQDDRNAVVFEENRDRPLPEVLAEAQQVYAQLLEALGTLSEEDLTDPGRFRDMPANWIPWQIIAGSSYEHYQQHTPSIRAWLDQAT